MRYENAEWDRICPRIPLPPYLAGYRPMKTTFLPGQRVQWMRRSSHGPARGSDIGVIKKVSKSTCTILWETENYTALHSYQNIQHLPFTRGPL